MTVKHPPPVNWLLEQWAEETGKTLQSMTDARPNTSCSAVSADGEPPALEAGTLYLEITFSVAAGAAMWVALSPTAAHALGNRTLQAAGIDDAGQDEIQNTCLEILQQAHAGLAQSISGRLKRAITSKGREIDRIADGNPLFSLQVTYPGSDSITVYFAASSTLLASLDPPDEPQALPVALEDRSTQIPTSKTFEVLLDVSMPVSVSFGRTEMSIKEVLKLTTGSIVELNRTLTEPVEVIINDRVIARGEVVVVDGNYGVRIHHIVSRQERFRSSAQAAMISKTELLNQ